MMAPYMSFKHDQTEGVETLLSLPSYEWEHNQDHIAPVPQGDRGYTADIRKVLAGSFPLCSRHLNLW